MKEYILSIAGVVLLSALFSILLPKGKMANCVRAACKMASLLVLVTPFATLARGEWLPAQKQIFPDGEYLAACARLAEEREGEALAGKLSAEYGITVTATVSCEEQSPFFVKKIAVSVTDFGIIPPDEHINILKKIEASLEKEYECTVELSRTQ